MSAHFCTRVQDLAPEYDLVIVGAGAAGLGAAAEAASHGIRPLVLDEAGGPGGQMFHAITRIDPAAYGVRGQDPGFLGLDYWNGLTLARGFLGSPVEYAPGAVVWSLEPGRAGLEVGISLGGAVRMLLARRIILTTGAMERPMPFPGWTLPGVMLAGAGQLALKTSGLVPDGRVVLAGCGPLLYLLASQLLAAGATVTTILDTTSWAQGIKALPRLPDFLRSPNFLKGLKLMLKLQTATRFRPGVDSLEAIGSDRVRGVRFRSGGRCHELEADILMLHQGIVPNINLPGAAGCALEWNPLQMAFQPRVDADGRSSVAGIAIAGDGAAVVGAAAAVSSGRLAALGALVDLGALDPSRQAVLQKPLRRALLQAQRGRRFLETLYRPKDSFRIPSDDQTIVCRCEEIRAGQVRAALALGVPGPNQLKTFLRCGMGPCQGRLCSLTISEMIAAHRRTDPQTVGGFQLRTPVKPITLGELASIPATPEALMAVTGSSSPQD